MASTSLGEVLLIMKTAVAGDERKPVVKQDQERDYAVPLTKRRVEGREALLGEEEDQQAITIDPPRGSEFTALHLLEEGGKVKEHTENRFLWRRSKEEVAQATLCLREEREDI